MHFPIINHRPAEYDVYLRRRKKKESRAQTDVILLTCLCHLEVHVIVRSRGYGAAAVPLTPVDPRVRSTGNVLISVCFNQKVTGSVHFLNLFYKKKKSQGFVKPVLIQILPRCEFEPHTLC